jgi:hypothetical protein
LDVDYVYYSLHSDIMQENKINNMKITEIQNRKTEIVTDIICDICGKSCKKKEDIINNDLRLDHGEPYYVFEYMTLYGNWGYYSESKDTEEWTAEVCEQCVDEKLSSLIKFKKKYDIWGAPKK